MLTGEWMGWLCVTLQSAPLNLYHPNVFSGSSVKDNKSWWYGMGSLDACLFKDSIDAIRILTEFHCVIVEYFSVAWKQESIYHQDDINKCDSSNVLSETL